MKWLALLVFGAALAGAELSDIHTVYVLPMSHGLDQHVANRLTAMRVLQVVTDPKLAETVLTDRIGESFEERMQELYPPPPAPPAPAKEKDAKEAAKEGKDGKDAKDKSKTDVGVDFKSAEKAGRLSTFGRGRGTLFLVDAKTKHVLWSVYDPPKDSTSAQLDKTAGRIVTRLKKDMTGN